MYNSNDIANMIKETAKTRNITIKKLLEIAGLNYNTMTHMKTSMPKADNLAKIADCLNCSVDYLLGRTDVPEVNTQKSSPTKEITFQTAAVGEGVESQTATLTNEEIQKIKQFLKEHSE